MATTRAQLVAAIGRRLGNYHSGTATAGTTTTITDTDLVHPDGWWKAHYAYILAAGGAAPAGQERPVSDYVQSSSLLTVNPAYTVLVESGDTYELLPMRRAEITAAIDEAVRASGAGWLVPVTDTTTVTIVADTYDYALPTDAVILLDALRRSSASAPWFPLDAATWRVGGTPGAQRLYFQDLSGLVAGDVLRLDYLRRLAALSTDASVLSIGEPAETEVVEFITEYALGILHNSMAARSPTGSDFRARLTMASDARQNALVIRERSRRNLHGPGRVHGRALGKSRG
jgi:hypothetical protein